MSRAEIKRHIDLQIISDWIEPKTRVLDLGCGRGILLEHLKSGKGVHGIGVDSDPQKILGCVKRGVSAYQGNADTLMHEFPDKFFDWVVCSRTVQELAKPETVINQALRVGKRLAMGFVNHGYWVNRVNIALHGRRVLNDVYPSPWHESNPSNPVTVLDFEEYCRDHKIAINQRVYLRGDWKTPCRFAPNLLAGYVLYDLSR